MPRSRKVSQAMRAQSRAQILKAARHLFAQHGYFNCKVADVAREAGMSSGNVYWYFSSKEDVLKAVLADGFEAQAALVADAAAHPGDSRSQLDFLVERYMAFCRERGEFVTILMSLMGHGGVPFLRDLGFDMPQMGLVLHQHLTSIFDRAQQEGIMQAGDSNSLAMFFFSFFSGLMVVYGEDWPGLPEPELRSGVLRLLGLVEPEEATDPARRRGGG